MTEKRFECNKGSRIIIDNETKLHYIMTLDWECSLVTKLLNRFAERNEELKKELHLMHMRTMFSTVQSFKGDVSKRYYYSEETDKVYDTANHYGQYDKVLDKKEIVMLLNEYETLLNNGDLE